MVRFYIFLFFIFFTSTLKGATYSENFDVAGNWGGDMSGYSTDKTYSRSGHPVVFACSNDALRETAGTQDSYYKTRSNSDYAWRIRNSGSGSWTATIASGGVGTFSVYVRRWDNSPDPNYVCEYSIDNGGSWTSVQTINNAWLGSSDYKQITGTINTSNGAGASDDIIIRIRRSGGERLMIDDFEMTDYASTTSPEIQLQQPVGTDVACGFSYDFGSAAVGTNTDLTVRIKNTGTATLNISGAALSGTNAAEFSIQTVPASTVATSSYTDMVIRYTPQVFGTKTATLTISSDDADESSCTIDLTASAYYNSCTELIISEYGEPTSGNGKYIEIYNGTSASIDLADYQLWSVSNGGTWPENTLSLSGTLASGATYVVANNITDVPGADTYNPTFCNWNGDDAVGLAKNVGGIYYLIDAIGRDGADPGSGWVVAGISNATEGHTLLRKSSVNIPDTNWTNSAGSNASNSEWLVRNYQLNNIGCNVNACLISTSVGFDVASANVTEANTNVTVNVTMSSAPTSTVNVIVSDALLGTATSGTDYSTFSDATLTFTPAESYPNTKTVTLNILDDAIPESNENIVLNVDAQCGALISNDAYSLTIIDNEPPEGLIINEFGQGSSEQEYIELVVAGTPGTTVDLRGWIVDDNSGIFSGGYGSQLGIAEGHIKFSDICTWEKVPVGSIILIYNASDKNPYITVADDPTDANLDYLYVVGIESFSNCASATSNLYFSSDCIKPNNSSYDQYTPAVYTNADWHTMQFRNAGDAVQVRSSNGGFFQGISYGDKGSGSDCSGCALNLSNHPDYSIYGSNALYFDFIGSNTIRTYLFENTISNDFRNINNWDTAYVVGTKETPGTFNGTNNQTWIESLRTPFDVVMDDQSYTCNLRAYESRFYLDNNDDIIYWIKNNTSTDHGSFTAATIIHDDATAGKGFQNTNLYGIPLFMQKTFTATPTTTSGANYKIKFFVSTQELQDYCDYINPILDSIFGINAHHNHTPAEVVGHIKIYRTSGTDRAWSVTTDAQAQIVQPVVGTYNGYTTFEYDGFTGFSGYALGDIVTPRIGLPVELTEFKANCEDMSIKLNWTTASEKNSDYYEIQRSSDGIHFTTIGKIAAAGNSNEIRHYEFLDKNPTIDANYYRLKQQDIGNATPTLSYVVKSSCDDMEDNLIDVFYNTYNGITFNIFSTKNEKMDISVFDISGQLLYQENRQINNGYSTFSLNMKNQLADGIYIVKIIGNQFISKKIMVH
ncbi:MAG: lamin tail domain-containing protein [Chitinophagales bacterium]